MTLFGQIGQPMTVTTAEAIAAAREIEGSHPPMEGFLVVIAVDAWLAQAPRALLAGAGEPVPDATQVTLRVVEVYPVPDGFLATPQGADVMRHCETVPKATRPNDAGEKGNIQGGSGSPQRNQMDLTTPLEHALALEVRNAQLLRLGHQRMDSTPWHAVPVFFCFRKQFAALLGSPAHAKGPGAFWGHSGSILRGSLPMSPSAVESTRSHAASASCDRPRFRQVDFPEAHCAPS